MIGGVAIGLRTLFTSFSTQATVNIAFVVFVELRVMGIENEIAKSPREHFARDDENRLRRTKERTLQRSTFDRRSQIAQASEPRTQLLAPAEIWRDLR